MVAPEFQADLPSLLKEVEAFALTDYTLALMKGNTILPEERGQIIERLARYTGLEKEYIDRTDLRINIFRFAKELLRSKNQTIGRLDSRFKGVDRDSAGEFFEFDPSMAAIMGPYTATFYDYVSRELKFESDLPYEILNPRVWPWTYDEHENRYVNVAETLRKALSSNPYLKVFIANGYYDLATPYFATQYTIHHLSLAVDLQQNISLGYYPAGHMIYLHQPSLEKLSRDLSEFIQQSIKTS